MSESATPEPTKPTSGDSSAPAPAPSEKKSKPGKWKRRLIWTGAILLGLAVVSRLLVELLLPSVMNKVAGRYDLGVNYDRLEMYALSGDVGLWHLNVTPKDGGESILQTDYCRGHIDLLGLLQGKLIVHRAEAEGVDLVLERRENGQIPLLERLLKLQNDFKSSSTPATPTKPVEYDLTSPLKIDVARLSHVKTHIRDKAVSPIVDVEVDIDMRLTDVGSDTRPAKFVLDVAGNPLIDSLRVEGVGNAHGKNLDAVMNVVMAGLHPKPAEGYLRLLGLRPAANDLSAHMTARITTSAATRPNAIQATLDVKRALLEADGAEALAMDHFTLNADAITSTGASFSTLEIDGVRGAAHRAGDGALGIAGIELDPHGPAAPSTRPVQTAAAPASALPVAHTATTKLGPWSLAQLIVKDGKLSLHDSAVLPNVDLAVLLSEFRVNNLVWDDANPKALATIAARASAPGIIGEMQLDGTALPFDKVRNIDLKLAASQIRPDALKPYLDALGLKSDWKSGQFGCAIHGTISDVPAGTVLDAKLSDVQLSDGDKLLALDGASISGAYLDLPHNLIHANSIAVAGPFFSAYRDVTGELAALGLRFDPNHRPRAVVQPTTVPAVVAIASSPSTQAAAIAVGALPRVELNHFTWNDIHLQMEDRFATPAVSFGVTDAGVDLKDLVIDLNPNAPTTRPATFHAWMKAPNFAGDLTADGTVTSGATGAVMHVDVAGRGLNSTTLAPYLKPLGIEPTMHDGTLSLKADAGVEQLSDGTLNAHASVAGASLKDGDQELLGVDLAEIAGVSVASSQIGIDKINVVKPRLVASRDAAGIISAAGVKIVPVPPSPAVPAASNTVANAPTTEPTTQPGVAATPVWPGPIIVLKHLGVDSATITWNDADVQPNTSVTVSSNVSLDNLILGRKADPAKLLITAKADGAMDALTVNGELSPDLASPRIALDVSATGLRVGPLAPYLPPAIHAPLANGQFTAKLQAGCDVNPAGGRAGQLSVTGVQFSDGNNPPLFAMTSAKVAIDRLDLRNRVIAIGEISTDGVETSAHRNADGAIEVLGLSIGGPQTATPPLAPATQPAAPADVTAGVPGLTPEATGPVGPTAIAKPVKFPLITIANVDLNLRKFTYSNGALHDGKAIELADVRVHNPKPIELLGDDPTNRPPVDLVTTGKINPLVGSFTVDTQLAPFAAQPGMSIDISASGIRGDGLTDIAPIAKEHVDGSQLTDGRFHAKFDSSIKYDRKNAMDFDVSRGFTADVAIHNVEFRAQPDGPVLAGLEELHSDSIRVDPATSTVRAKVVEITKPIGNFWREPDGVHALGWVIKLPDFNAPATPTTQPEVATAQPEPPVPPTTPPTKPTGEIRIDKLLMSGLDVQIADHTLDPPVVVPLSGLDVEVHDISSLMMTEPRTMRFSAMLNAGKVALPPRANQRHPAGTTLPTTEDRDLFSQATAAGQIALYPKPKGWVKTSMSGLDLAALRGAAHEFGVTLNEGSFDSNVDLKMAGDGNIDTHSKLVLTDLSLTEPAGGPIQKKFGLSAPLDVVLAAVRDPDGGITLPLNVPIREGKISGGDITGAAIGAVASVMLTAVASAPLKVVGGMGDLLGGGKAAKVPEQPVIVQFQPGDVGLSSSDTATLAALIARMRKDPNVEVTIKHDLGGGDLTQAEVRANPDADSARTLADRVRARRVALVASQSDLAGRVRTAMASAFDPSESKTLLDQLKSTNRDLASVEDALDHIGDMLRPGADRQRDRRTRAACLEISQTRLNEVRDVLARALPANASDRIHVARPQFSQPDNTNGGTVTMTAVVTKK